jgi:uncharacterized protein YdcH (DUF465 family)
MTESTQGIQTTLGETTDELQQLAGEHHQLEDRLQELASRPFLSEPEQAEEVAIKKRKLMLKDRMESILHQHRVPAHP